MIDYFALALTHGLLLLAVLRLLGRGELDREAAPGPVVDASAKEPGPAERRAARRKRRTGRSRGDA